MNIKIIACHVFYRELSYLAAISDNVTSAVWLPQGLHNTPDLLRKAVQDEIDKAEYEKDDTSALYHNKAFDAIVLGYGLCSNGVIGLKSNKIPIIIPKTDDCIGVFLGSQKRYLDYFNTHAGIYWYNAGWIETTTMPSKERYELMRLEYNEKYGEENAEFLLEQEMSWVNNYNWCAYIKSPIYEKTEYMDFAKQVAADFKWNYDQLDGSDVMLKMLLSGDWDNEHFLIVPPGYVVEPTFDGSKIKAVKVI